MLARHQKMPMLMEKVNGYRVPSQEEITKEINSICALARKTNGISKVKSEINFDDFIDKILIFRINFRKKKFILQLKIF